MGGAVTRVTREQVSHGDEGERQDGPVWLGEVERSFDRVLGGAPVAELLARCGVEQRRLEALPMPGEAPSPLARSRAQALPPPAVDCLLPGARRRW